MSDNPGVSFSRAWWGVSGLVAGATGLAASYALAALLHVREAPVVAVAEVIARLTPGGVVRWAISQFGDDDKAVLTMGILVFLVVVSWFSGRLARARWWLACAMVVAVSAIGAVAVATKAGGTGVELLPVVVGAVVWIVLLAWFAEMLRNWELVEAAHEPADEPTHSRRWFFVSVGSMAVVAAAGGAIGRWAGSGRRKVEEVRDLLRLEMVTDRQPPPRAAIGVDGVAPWRTSSSDFYVIDTAFSVPTIDPGDWSIRIHGMVEREIVLTYDDLLTREMTEDWITLNCVSNPIGGDLIGNAWWSGIRLAGLLAEAGPTKGADAVLQTSDDGWTCGTPLDTLTDDRNAMLAVAMNGKPLPIEHGFPVRTIVPGLYGYVSACKWVVDLEVTRFSDITAYWTDKGWSELGPVKLSSRIDVPGSGDDVAAGEVVVAGSAWAQHTGVSGVEVSLDGGPWVSAELARVPNQDTWVQWAVTVDLDAGDHEVRARAIDADGVVQAGIVRDVRPDGATGWHTVGFSTS